MAAMLGAEEFGFGTSVLVAIGCDMARQCHLNTCPTGIATQKEDLRAKFTGTPEMVIAYFTHLAKAIREDLAALGRPLDRRAGRPDRSARSARSGRRPRRAARCLSAFIAEPAPAEQRTQARSTSTAAGRDPR